MRWAAPAYGTYAALLSLSFLLNIVLDLGMTNHNTRHIAQHTHLMGKTLGGVLGARLVLVVLYAVLTVGGGVGARVTKVRSWACSVGWC